MASEKLDTSPAQPAAGGPRRMPGRPPLREQEETRQIIIEAAAGEFVAMGFAKASIGRIARAAGVSTRTLYKVAAGKDELFRIVVEQRIARTVAGFSRKRALSPADELSTLARTYAGFVLGPEAQATLRILGEQQERFPDLAASFRRNAARVSDAFDAAAGDLLARRFAVGDDGAGIARMLRLVFLGQQRQQTLGLAPPMDTAEIAAFAGEAVRLIALGDQGAAASGA